jgi:pantoate--beta-alanine ligase
MEIVKTIDEVRTKVREAKNRGMSIGFVPTMGFLHTGHLSLVKRSRESTTFQVMSIFVNKMQFNNTDDFDSYPVDLKRDFELAEKIGVDLIFLPDDGEIYKNNLTSVNIDLLTDNLCGAYRPGHYTGVLTIVSKLFNIIQPDLSVFGQKDIQQAISIEKMIEDLNFPVKIIIAPTVREEGGLAMSSRNKHLTPELWEKALSIYKGLKKAEELILSGLRNADMIISEIEKILKEEIALIDYVSLVKYSDLSIVHGISGKCVLAIAVNMGETRLIDNMVIEFNNGEIKCIY